ncbi:hypothetical protein BV898_01479 [Hypsibius exemplaris]|uniref:Uncharacterized protein n=1 Tax=Hypsibius exemplaris TaxID=2072580 RepID=A0A1W0XBK9_HYPEX|nr:hypothetical protein BV898_01479 [Hypsibius exemplaris]
MSVVLPEDAFLCNAFVPFVKKDEYLTGRDHSSVHSFFAASPIQESILVRVFFVENLERCGIVYADTMQCVSQLQLHIPLEKRGISTGKLFVFHVLMRFVQEPEGLTVTVKDADGIVYGCCRIIRSVTY